ncbi:apyrase putative [Entamoeba histolytica]|uniref:Apyrase putative n=1 Tax=Entamoeba histolytica TaxID=5759 RepID=A0A175JL06_ENTHI|nr:apyrase putative [Entamoeba histolytica]
MNKNDGLVYLHYGFVLVGIIVLFLFVFVFYIKLFNTSLTPNSYQYQPVYKSYHKNSPILRVALVSDLDKASKEGQMWRSVVIVGIIFRQGNSYDFQEQEEFNISLPINENGRGMELSELLSFNGSLYGFDDRTGLVCAIDIEKKKAYPRLILRDGDSFSDKGMKIEWATVYKDSMYVGSIGKEFTTPTGEYLNDNPLYVKQINVDGKVSVLNWKNKFNAIKNAVRIYGEGYMIHEAVAYSVSDNKWYFAPRKCSNERYDDIKDEVRGCPYIISTKDFIHFNIINDPQHDFNKGFSSIKILPHDENKLIYLKSVEVGKRSETYMGMISTTGEVIMKEKLITKMKMEGIEFIPI